MWMPKVFFWRHVVWTIIFSLPRNSLTLVPAYFNVKWISRLGINNRLRMIHIYNQSCLEKINPIQKGFRASGKNFPMENIMVINFSRFFWPGSKIEQPKKSPQTINFLIRKTENMKRRLLHFGFKSSFDSTSPPPSRILTNSSEKDQVEHKKCSFVN